MVYGAKERGIYLKAIIIGILASLFFSSTFILNRSMEISGGSWIWSASLRFIFMVPFLFLIVFFRGNLRPLFHEIRRQPLVWVGWSFVGFVLLYAPITIAASFGPGWLIAGTWQITIIAGSLITPLFYEKINTPEGTLMIRQQIPMKGLMASLIILAGILVIQLEQAKTVSFHLLLISMVLVIIAAFSYPLGNRKMMEICDGRLDVFQRVLGMTLASLPFWILLSIYGWLTEGSPNSGQIVQSFLVAILSGIIGTVLFFLATDMVRNNPQQLASVEATQSGEVLFALIGEIIILAGEMPNYWSFLGLLMIIGGMILHSIFSHQSGSLRAKSKAA